MTVATVRSWRPTALDDAAADLVTARTSVDDISADAAARLRTLPQVWLGEAGEAARAAARWEAERTDAFAEVLGHTRRILLACSDAIAAAQALLEDAIAYASSHGLRVSDDGSVSSPPPFMYSADTPDAVVAVLRQEYDAAKDAQAAAAVMVRQALAAAEEADRDTAAALRAAFAAGAITDDELAAVDAITAREVPAVGTDPREVAAWWATLTPEQRDRLVLDHPELIGNLDGVPYDVRIQANRTNIANTLADSADAIDELEARIAGIEQRIGELARSGSRADAVLAARLHADLADLETRLAYQRDLNAMCHNLLTSPTTGFDANGDPVDLIGHQVIVFDPANGRFAEIVGSINAGTKNIGVMVPGTGANLFTMDGQYERCLDFVTHGDVDPPGSLAVLSWLGGPMPPEVMFDAFDTSYANNLAGELTRFVGGIDNPAGVPVTVVGHSYGGSVVGAAESVGMRVDRIVHVASAGAGPGVRTIDDYAHPGTARYSMTAPGDLITYAQGTSVGPLGHGADPDLLDDVIRLETGYVDTANPERGLLSGPSAHSGVFERDTTAFQNILGVMTGGEVSLFSPPVEVYHPPGPGTQGWYEYVNPMEDPSYRPPTSDVS